MVTLEPDTPSLTHHRHGKVLIAFDFDHTIVEENTDVFIRRLLGPDGLPQDIQAQQKSLGWTKFMGAIFQHLHDRGITSNQIRDLLQRTPLTPGMDQLLRYLHEKNHVFDCAIISDANSLFIWWLLHFTRLEKVFPLSNIYTNPARIDDTDCLCIDFYHHNTTCQLSAPNLCKGRVLQEHILRMKREESQQYRTVVFVGDGLNDYCPAVQLSAGDFIAARKGYKLIDKIREDRSAVEANLVPWVDGEDLLEFVKTLEKKR